MWRSGGVKSCVYSLSSLRRGHANLLCICSTLIDINLREEEKVRMVKKKCKVMVGKTYPKINSEVYSRC